MSSRAAREYNLIVFCFISMIFLMIFVSGVSCVSSLAAFQAAKLHIIFIIRCVKTRKDV